MFEKKILSILHVINLEFLKKNETINNYSFYNFFKSIIHSSHILIKISYKILLTVLIFFSILSNILFLSKKKELFIFKLIVRFLNKIYLFRDILKFIKIYSIIFNYD